MRALVALDKFKDALSAPEACRVVADTLRRLRPHWEVAVQPLTDGGEGFAPILAHAAGGSLDEEEVRGPLGQPRCAAYGWVQAGQVPPAAAAMLPGFASLPPSSRIAIVEMAAASGLAAVPVHQRDPWLTSSYGTGQLLRAATRAGAAGILLGVGGSATQDLGLGALLALGWSLEPDAPARSWPCPAHWPGLTRICPPESPLHLPPIWIACDVDNPLLGPRGTVAAFAKQKGLLDADGPRLEEATAHWAALLAEACRANLQDLVNTPGAGAAGGIACGLMAAGRAKLVPGAGLVSAWTGLDAALAAADLVVTGEGRLDRGSLGGKGPAQLAKVAAGRGAAVWYLAGRIAGVGPEGLPATLQEVSPAHLPLPEALVATPRLLAEAVEQLLHSTASGSSSGSSP